MPLVRVHRRLGYAMYDDIWSHIIGCLCIYIYIYLDIHGKPNTYIYIFIHVHMYLVCLYLWFLYIYLYIYIYVCNFCRMGPLSQKRGWQVHTRLLKKGAHKAHSYPLVNGNKNLWKITICDKKTKENLNCPGGKPWKITMIFMGQLPISMAMASKAILTEPDGSQWLFGDYYVVNLTIVSIPRFDITRQLFLSPGLTSPEGISINIPVISHDHLHKTISNIIKP